MGPGLFLRPYNSNMKHIGCAFIIPTSAATSPPSSRFYVMDILQFTYLFVVICDALVWDIPGCTHAEHVTCLHFQHWTTTCNSLLIFLVDFAHVLAKRGRYLLRTPSSVIALSHEAKHTANTNTSPVLQLILRFHSMWNWMAWSAFKNRQSAATEKS